MKLLKYLVPHIRLADLPAMLGVAIVGGMIAGLYGIVHDQVTYSISSEYFTKLKFDQFRYADLGLGNRMFAGTIGFLATWWAGLFSAWLLARRLIPEQPRSIAHRQIGRGIAIIFSCVLLFGIGGYLYGIWRGPTADYSAWKPILRVLRIDEEWAFVRVAYIHNAGYLGVVVGLILALVVIRPVLPSNGKRPPEHDVT